jgi:hypothetical protein
LLLPKLQEIMARDRAQQQAAGAREHVEGGI